MDFDPGPQPSIKATMCPEIKRYGNYGPIAKVKDSGSEVEAANPGCVSAWRSLVSTGGAESGFRRHHVPVPEASPFSIVAYM